MCVWARGRVCADLRVVWKGGSQCSREKATRPQEMQQKWMSFCKKGRRRRRKRREGEKKKKEEEEEKKKRRRREKGAVSVDNRKVKSSGEEDCCVILIGLLQTEGITGDENEKHD